MRENVACLEIAHSCFASPRMTNLVVLQSLLVSHRFQRSRCVKIFVLATVSTQYMWAHQSVENKNICSIFCRRAFQDVIQLWRESQADQSRQSQFRLCRPSRQNKMLRMSLGERKPGEWWQSMNRPRLTLVKLSIREEQWIRTCIDEAFNWFEYKKSRRIFCTGYITMIWYEKMVARSAA